MVEFQYRFRLLIIFSIALCLLLLWPAAPGAAQEPWPPFWFDLIPSYTPPVAGDEAGKIIYKVGLYSRVEWPMPDLTIKIPLPTGTRFVEATGSPTTRVDFDGREITFFNATFDQYEEGSFTVEITNPDQTVFTTHGWIAWKGERQGDYLAEEVSLDITREPLNWQPPGRSRLQLEIGALVANEVITYHLYPQAIERQRMWDLSLNLPLPPETTLLAADAPPPITTNFNGQELSFFTLELERQAEVGPLTVQLATTENTPSPLTTAVWTDWKNSGFRVGVEVPAQERMKIDLMLPHPNVSQFIVFDRSDDVPFANYDLTSLAFQEDGSNLMVIFHTAAELGPPGQPLLYTLFVDSDCRTDTGQPLRPEGANYQIRYNHESGRAWFVSWDAATGDWAWSDMTRLNSLVNQNLVTISVPTRLLTAGQTFCWRGRASNRTERFNPSPPSDWLPDREDSKLNRYEPGRIPPENGLMGHLAIPLLNEEGFYDVHIYSLPDGLELATLLYARQPNFRSDGRRILVNHENTANTENIYRYETDQGKTTVLTLQSYETVGNIYEYDLASQTERLISADAQDAYPFYDPTETRLVYQNPTLLPAPDQTASPHLFVQCSLRPPQQESRPACQNLTGARVLVSAAQPAEITGSYPVWTNRDLIAYQGCPEQVEGPTCGIHLIDSLATKEANLAVTPLQITQNAADIPADSQGDLLAFSSNREDNWEVYLVNLDGTGLRNLSSRPQANDGLPAISPNGRWIAFVSDRSGQWAVWVIPIWGGLAQKLFDLPNAPWGTDERDWTKERISWGF